MKTACLAAFFRLTHASAPPAEGPKRPNIVLIIADRGESRPHFSWPMGMA